MKKLILSLALLVGLASTSALAAPQGLSYLNGDADILVHFDFQRLQKSQTFKDIMAMAMSEARRLTMRMRSACPTTMHD